MELVTGILLGVDEAPEDLPRRNASAVITEVISADVHQPDKAVLPGARNRKCAWKPLAVERLAVLPAVHLPPGRPVRRCIDESSFQMPPARAIFTRVHCIVNWHNYSLFEMVT
jgi:hypothetical protein